MAGLVPAIHVFVMS